MAQADARPHWPELDDYGVALHSGAHSAICFVAIPPHSDVSTVLALCRAAHEVWILDGSDCELSQQLLAFRTQSAPPTLNEKKSILHAPEVGLVRVWRKHGNTLLENQVAQPVKPITKDAIAHLLTLHRLLATNPSRTPEDWFEMANALRQHASSRRRLVRCSLAGLFALTVLGVIGLQMLSMSPWRIPMADLYAVFYLLVGTLYLWGKRQQWNTEQLAWMSLAEALESQSLLGRAGFRHGAITGLFLLRHRRSVEWIREALRPMTWALYAHAPDCTSSTHQLLSQWVPLALRRHSDVARRQRRKTLALEWGMRCCYAVGGVLTVIAVAGVVDAPATSMAVSIGIGLTSAMGTLMLIFNSVLGFAQDADLHDHLTGVFAHARQCLSQPLSSHEYDELLLDLVEESIQQSAERVLL